MLKVAIIIGSTRPGRKAEAVARWAYDIARKRTDAEFEVVDIASFNLLLLDEPMPPMFGQYSHDHTKAWSAKIASFDGFIFVTPEYNHATSGALKNAIDFLHNDGPIRPKVSSVTAVCRVLAPSRICDSSWVYWYFAEVPKLTPEI